MSKEKSKLPIPETEEERTEAIKKLALQEAERQLPGRKPDDMEVTNLMVDLAMEYGSSYPESRESRGQ